MKTEQQRIAIAIAEACGLKTSHVAQGGGAWMRSAKPFIGSWTTRDNEGSYEYGRLPDYLNDLNAMHEAEKVFNHDQACEFVSQLDAVMDRAPRRFGKTHYWNAHVLTATAAQRAEAFLRTLNLWEASS